MIASHERAAACFQELTGVRLSKSSLHRLVEEAGQAVVAQQEEEAQAMVRVSKGENEVRWRDVPAPESEVMAASADGVMLNIREEGWKEVKTASISTVTVEVNPKTGKREVTLGSHSYRAGLWDAPTFTNHYWAEACRRGLEKAKTVVPAQAGMAHSGFGPWCSCALPGASRYWTGGMQYSACGVWPTLPWNRKLPPRG